MKRALRMFGNRLGNCAYDKVFLKDIKNRPSSGPATFISANYPKISKQDPCRTNNLTNTVIPAIAAAVEPSPIPNTVSVPAPPNIVTPIPYDESMFDNSMMISEEDLVTNIQEDLAQLTEASVIEFDESFGKTYPLLPNKRK